MLQASVPAKFPIWWASAADPAYVRNIPENSQVGVQDGAASLETGFPPLTFQQLAAGGSPPFGQDFNGILRMITTIQQWQQAGGGWKFDSAFAADIGGYPAGAILQSNLVLSRQWQSTVDGNLTDPDDPANASGWLPVGLPPGTPVPSMSSAVSSGSGFLPANGLTIGSAASNASLSNGAACIFLYAANWFNYSTTACPIYTSAGVLTTRGANPYADFAANKALAMPDMRGRGVIGVDTMAGAATTRLSGVPFSIGNNTTPGSFCGENFHTLVNNELSNHFHTAGIADGGHLHGATFGVRGFSTSGSAQAFQTPPGIDGSVNNNTNVAVTGVRVNSSNGLDTTSSTGGGAGHNTVEQNVTCFWNLKL